MHYVEEGEGETRIVFLHGIPVNLFLWRNVIPYVSKHSRTIAIDMIGFGKSDKPLDIDYNLINYTPYLEQFIEVMGLENVIIVVMDLGLMIRLN